MHTKSHIIIIIDLLRPKTAHNMYKDRKKHQKLKTKIHQKLETTKQITERMKYIYLNTKLQDSSRFVATGYFTGG